MDEARPPVSALAVRGGVVVAVGSDDDVRPLIGRQSQVMRLAGRTVTPGLVDGHAHLYGLGVAMETVSLRGAASEAAAVEAVARAAAELPTDEWVIGRGWDQNVWAPVSFPGRASLDAAVGQRPAALYRVDGHALWVNSRALALAGVGRDTPSPPGGKILRDAAGEPNGILIDAAMAMVQRHIPKPTGATLRRRILAAAQHAAACGLTGVHEMGIGAELAAAYQALADEGLLPIRVYGYWSYGPDTLEALDAGRLTRVVDDAGTDRFVLRGIKAFADGALGSRGAALVAPYSDEPDNLGLMVTSADELARLAEAAARTGWQLAVHAIGDRANRAVLDAYERALAAEPAADVRWRVEHAQVLAAEDIARFGQLGVLASIQPTHATSDMPWAELRLGPDRVRGAYAWRAVKSGGGRLVAGSDFPVEQVSPLLGLYAAVTRQDRQGAPVGGWFADQRLTLDEALAAFTVEPAYAAFAEGQRGRLAPGYVADITVFDRPLAADRRLLATQIEATFVGGAAAFASAWAQQALAAPAPVDITCR
jgi:predicted amidohydrolase YtcJ